MINLEIAEGGMVVARFTGGREQAVAQWPWPRSPTRARWPRPETTLSFDVRQRRLRRSGRREPAGRGEVRGAALESSTVDIASEFTHLIRYQRAYQANSRVVTTADEVTQETLNLKR